MSLGLLLHTQKNSLMMCIFGGHSHCYVHSRSLVHDLSEECQCLTLSIGTRVGQAVGALRLSWHLCSHQESPSAHCQGSSGPLSWGRVLQRPLGPLASFETDEDTCPDGLLQMRMRGRTGCISEPWEASCRVWERQGWPSQSLGSGINFVAN